MPQSEDYLRDIGSVLKTKSGIRKKAYIYSKNKSLVATPSPFRSDQIVIMGLRPPVLGILIAVLTEDPTWPEYGEQPFACFFPPNETTKKSLITFEGIRRAFGMDIFDIYKQLTSRQIGGIA